MTPFAFFSTRRLVGRVSVLGLSAFAASAAQDSVAKQLPPTITVTRGVGRSTLDLPFAITSTTPDSARPGATHLLAEETLFDLPGVTVANRFNPSQDTRISIRGFGARSQFGIRSIRIMRDGMPITLPDGQTPIDYLDLEDVGQVEVMRGTAAALYGNASGGVIDLRSPPPPTARIAPEVRWFMGSNGLERETALVGGTVRNFWYEANAGHTTADNARAYSHQKLTNGFLHAGTTVKGTVLTLTGIGLDMPVAENPGAVTLAQAENDPTSADSLSVARKARKAVQQIQVGLSASHRFGNNELSGQFYDGRRALYNPLTSNVVDVKRRLNGGSLKYTGLTPGLASALHVDTTSRYTVGYDYQWFGDDRVNWATCDGITKVSANCPVVPSEKGVLQLNQREIVSGSGIYAREDVDIAALRVTAGVRNDQVGFTLRDHFLADGRDDSGRQTLRATNPIFALGYRLTPLHSVYANYSTAFETPTTTEFGNHADGTAGLNPDLKPQYSHTVDVGIKGLAMSRLVYDASLFDTHVRDELIPYEVATGDGRTFYRNAGTTRRRGAELSASTSISKLEVAATYTLSDFHFVHDSTATGTNDGNTIPGIPERQAELSTTWREKHYFAVAEWAAKSATTVNDANTASAPGYAIVNLRFGGTLGHRSSVLIPIAGVQNLFGRRYISSVAINAAAATAKYYEPGAGRSFFGGFQIKP